MVDIIDKHSDLKQKVKNLILHIEEHEMLFTRDEIISHAKEKGFNESEVREAIDELISERYIHEVIGTDGPLLSRTIWRDYSPAFEDRPEV